MKPETLRRCITEAQRFIDRAEVALMLKESIKNMDNGFPDQWNAAAKRASQDLTRALAYLRRER